MTEEQQEVVPQEPQAISQESKNNCILIWVLTIFFGFIPGLVFYLINKDDAYVQDQAKEALNWSITATIIYLIGFVLTLIVVGILVIAAIGIVHMVFSIMGAVAVSSGKPFRVPFAWRLIK